MTINKFNIRVYGILFDENKRVLVSDENIHGQLITKFPGGGLEFGEGLSECVIREFMEETNQKISIKSHFYTTDFFQVSAFNAEHQIISVYYLVECKTSGKIKTSEQKFDFTENASDAQSLRWIDFEEINADEFTLPIDKFVAEKIQ